MKALLALPVVVAGLALAGSASAAGLTTTGTIAPVCGVTVNPTSFDPTVTTLQKIAGLVVTCNTPGTKNLNVKATNGYFAGPAAQHVNYALTVDLDGPLLPFNAVPSTALTGAGATSAIGAPDANVAAGLNGNFDVALATKPFLAGTYSETWNITVA